MTFQEQQVHVALTTTEEGQERVSLTLGSAAVVMLTPSQARALATELITAVNRAEVKANLKVSHNLWRRVGETPTRLQPAE